MTTRFEWDPAKAESNLRKHGVSFEYALRVFADPFLMTAPDGIEGGELRWKAVGSMGDFTVIVVVHTVRERNEDGREIEIVRIISARRADRTERGRYERETREF
ncbi:MAG: BrnT family toxin [Methylorubrum rhodinum]|uniref:BrnT family toxin n=1 Tax=Methylorubrum rhodinum TaxID=29428 RepID=UPI003BAF83C1